MQEENKTIILCSSNSDSDQPTSPYDYFINRDGEVLSGSSNTDSVRILLANLGRVKLYRYKCYPITFDANRMPVADTSRPPVRYFYEFCEFRQFKGWQYFESYPRPQLDALAGILRQLGAKPGDVVLESEISRYVYAPHPEPELKKIISNL